MPRKAKSFESLHATALTADCVRAQEIVLAGSDGEPRLVLKAAEDGDAALQFRDLAGRLRMIFGVGREGCPQFALYGKQGVPNLSVALIGGSVQLLFSDDSGMLRWSLTIDESGRPVGATPPAAESDRESAPAGNDPAARPAVAAAARCRTRRGTGPRTREPSPAASADSALAASQHPEATPPSP